MAAQLLSAARRAVAREAQRSGAREGYPLGEMAQPLTGEVGILVGR